MPSVAQWECRVLDDSVLLPDLNASREVPPLLFMLWYVFAFFDSFDAQIFVLVILVDEHNFYMMSSKCHSRVTAAGAGVRPWILSVGKGAARTQGAGLKTGNFYTHTQKNENKSTVCIGCITVFAFKTAIVISCNQPHIHAWALYILTMFFPPTGLQIAWTMLVLFWCLNIAPMCVRILSWSPQACVAMRYLLFHSHVAQPFLRL